MRKLPLVFRFAALGALTFALLGQAESESTELAYR